MPRSRALGVALAAIAAIGCAGPSREAVERTAGATDWRPEPSALLHAKRAFDAGTWELAAIGFAKASQDGSLSPRDREMAEHYLGASLFELGLSTASLSIFEAIAETSSHAALEPTFRMLMRLARKLPDGADVGPILAKFPEELRAKELHDAREPLRSRVLYLLGRHAYATRNYPGAIAELGRVAGPDLARAQLLIALCHVQSRKSVPAVDALLKVDEPAWTTGDPLEDARLRDLARITIARVYYSVSVRVDMPKRLIRRDAEKMLAAVRYFSRVDPSGELGTEARFERAWAHFMLGDSQAAFADIGVVLATSGTYAPEAEQLSAHVRWSTGAKEPARAAYKRVLEMYEPVHTELAALINTLERDADTGLSSLELVERALDRPGDLPATIRPAVIHSLADRQLRGKLEYLRRLDGERENFGRMSDQFIGSAAGERAKNGLERARRAVVQQLGEMARARLKYRADELDVILRECREALAASERVGG